MPFTDATRSEAQRLVARYAVARSALLPLLHLVQSVEGYVSEDGIGFCAELLGLTKAEVGAVATFYTMYKREPVGDYLLSVCTNPTCQIAGGQKIYDDYLEACGGTQFDRDAGVMVEHAECLGICDAAPVVTINYENYGRLTHDEAMDLLAKAKAGEPPESPLSKHVPDTFTAVEREFSGIDDGTDEHLIEAARLQASMSPGPSYRTGEAAIPVLHPGGDPVGHGGAVFRETSQIGGPIGSSDTDVQISDTEAEAAESAAGESGGKTGQLGAQMAEQGPDARTPPADDQPSLDEDGATPTEQDRDSTAAGTEADPDDSIAGEGGKQRPGQPVGDRDVPSEDDATTTEES